MLKISHLAKKFERTTKQKKKEEFYADKDISFEVKEGEILGVLGPNGAGKTTLLRMIAGILSPTEGTVTFDGKDYPHNEIDIKKKLLTYPEILKFIIHYLVMNYSKCVQKFMMFLAKKSKQE